MMLVIRLAVAVATLGLLSSIPAAGQAKLSPQQLNSSTLNVNKPIATPKVYSPSLNKPISTPKALAVQRPVPDNKPRPSGSSSAGAQLDMIRVQERVNQIGQISNVAKNVTHGGGNCSAACQNIK
jgi:hypothetical protein